MLFLRNLVLFLLIAVLDRTKVLSFNIETRSPIVKSGPKNTYFGFSVAQHAESKTKNANDYWILVGAPLDQNLQPGTNKSGALYKCPTSIDGRCEQIPTDGRRTAAGRYNFEDFDYDDTGTNDDTNQLAPPGIDEIKNNQWLGVTVKSQKAGGKVVVCAHRYIQSPDIKSSHFGYGLCYVLTSQLNVTETLQPCQGRPTDKLHQQYGFCQVGTSLAVLEDEFAVMGSPGPYTWRGTIFATDITENYLIRDHTKYKGPLNNDPTPINKYSYLGMSVTGGVFFNKSVINYVSGAPRSQFHGQVFFFSKKKSVEDMKIELILNGTQFGSSFGYEILAVDIDLDGFDELLVAAPFYYSNNKGGVVYLYKDLSQCTSGHCKPVTNLTGNPESRFGFAMASLGDINKDGYTDVAIGAPYDFHGHGAVYIFLGSKNGLKQEPSQVITHRNILTLGYSLSGGLDMDLNEYPDLLVGAYESDTVILYKTRSIIDIQITVEGDELKNINGTKKGCRPDPTSNKTCFSFTTCFTLSKPINKKFHISYEIKEVAKIPRVTFKDDVVKLIEVTGDKKNTKKCTNQIAYLVEGNGDILSPIKLQVNYTKYDDPIDSPILNTTSVKKFEATFQKNCGEDDICHSHLILSAVPQLNKTDDEYIFDVGKNKELLLNITIQNTNESAYEAKLFVMHPDNALSYIALQVDKNKTISATCTSSNTSSALVTCNLGNPLHGGQTMTFVLRFEITTATKPDINLEILVNSTSNETSTETKRDIRISLQKIASYLIKGQSRPSNILYSGTVRGQSAMKTFADVGPKVIHSYDVINQGDYPIDNIRVIIHWPYQVAAKGIHGGKWLLYLDKNPVVIYNSNNITECEVDQSKVNPLKLEATHTTEDPNGSFLNRVRRRTDVEDAEDEEIRAEKLLAFDGKKRNIVTMDCDKGTAKCVEIVCRIDNLYSSSEVKINISARVWNSTLLEDYNNIDWVSIRSKAQIQILDRTIIHSNTSVGITSIETQAYPVALADKEVNIWIIIGSVIAGLILLIAIIVILYKCGFFKRNRVKDHTLSANLTKQSENEILLQDSKGKKSGDR